METKIDVFIAERQSDFLSYLWGMETSDAELTQEELEATFYPTYEEWKLRKSPMIR